MRNPKSANLKFDLFECVSLGLAAASPGFPLRGPAVILFILRDTCSDSIAVNDCSCLFLVGYLHNYHAICSEKWAIAQMLPCVKLSTKGGVSHAFWGVLTLP